MKITQVSKLRILKMILFLFLIVYVCVGGYMYESGTPGGVGASGAAVRGGWELLFQEQWGLSTTETSRIVLLRATHT